jgi:hypothetical protein
MEAWRAVVERLRLSRPSVASAFELAIPLEVGPQRVVIGFDAGSEFASTRANDPEALEVLTREARAYFGVPTQVVIDAVTKAASSGARSVASVDAEQRALALADARTVVQTHPVVEEAIRVFGARVVEVKLPTGDG